MKVIRLISILAVLLVAITVAKPAKAAMPNNQACLGNDVSGYAEGGSDFGALISSIAMTANGVGQDVQAHLAGQVPDEVIPNSCNDE